MSADETLLGECLEDYRARRARGEAVEPDVYREQLNDAYDEFVELVSTESLFDEALSVPEEFDLPRPFGRYTLLRELGRGAVGVVYEAHDELHDRIVAVKVLRVGFASDPSARRRFLREAKACRQIQHLNIVEIHDAGEIEHRPYYAMSLVRGPTLSDLIRRGEAPDPKTLCAGLSGVASALAMLHENGIVHRDVKPSNIILDPDGRMVLTDFGLVRLDTASTLTRTGSTLGTPLYMSPEQMMGDDATVDGRVDIYALGATLYEGLVGDPPFSADDYHHLIPKILAERPKHPSRLNAGVPRACSRIALTCLEKQARDRYPTAEDLAADLRSFAGDGPVRGRPLRRRQRAWRWVVRHPVVTGVVSVLLVLALSAWWVRPALEPATLDVTLEQTWGVITLNGGDPLDPPLKDHPLEPGHYVMRCTAEDFVDKVIDFDARPGTKQKFHVSLSLPYPVSPEALERISKRLGRRSAPSEEGGN